MRRLAQALGLTFCAALIWFAAPPLQMGVAVVAHDICSKAFTAGLEPDRVFADSAGAIHYQVDRTQKKSIRPSWVFP